MQKKSDYVRVTTQEETRRDRSISRRPEIVFFSELGIGFVSVPSWWDPRSDIPNMGLVSQLLARCDQHGHQC